MSLTVYPGAVFERAHRTEGFPVVRYQVISMSSERPGWWACAISVGGRRDIPGRALLNPGCYRPVP